MKNFSQVLCPTIVQKLHLLKFTNDLLLLSDQGCISLLVLLDLKAAFDTIDHNILIYGLQNYTGIQGQALRWFRSYLSDRCHFVYLNGESSQLSPVKYGVPLGSVLGTPVYFQYTCCPLVILLENMGYVSIVMLMILNYISQLDQMKLINYLS